MNSISDEQIWGYLESVYAHCKMKYKEDRILGVCVIGDANYGTAARVDDIKFLAFYIPTFEEMCISTTPKNEDIWYGGLSISVRDFRLAYEMSLKHTNVTEALYTEYRICNPLYENTFELRFIEDRDFLSRHSKDARIRFAADNGLNALMSGDLYTAHRLLLFCQAYERGDSYDLCMNPQDEVSSNLLWSLKNTKAQIPEAYRNSLSAATKVELEKITNRHSSELNSDPIVLDRLRFAIISIMELATTARTESFNFVKELSDVEKICLKSVLERIGWEGDISKTDLVKELGISRAKVDMLFDKMKNSGVAEVINRGSKGTHIKILDARITSISK